MCPGGGAAQRPRCKFGILFRPWNFIRQARPYSESQLFPALCPMFAVPTFMRYAYQRWPTRRPSAEFYFCELFCHFPSSAIVSDGPHCVPERNELFRPVSFHSRRLSLSLSLFPVPTGVYIDLHSTVRPINISTRTFACKSRRQGENDDASGSEFTHTNTGIQGVLWKIHATGVHPRMIRTYFFLRKELLWKMRIYRNVFLFISRFPSVI